MQPCEHLCGFKENLDLLVANITIAKNQFSQNSPSLTSTIINQSIKGSITQLKVKIKGSGEIFEKNSNNNQGGPLGSKEVLMFHRTYFHEVCQTVNGWLIVFLIAWWRCIKMLQWSRWKCHDEICYSLRTKGIVCYREMWQLRSCKINKTRLGCDLLYSTLNVLHVCK